MPIRVETLRTNHSGWSCGACRPARPPLLLALACCLFALLAALGSRLAHATRSPTPSTALARGKLLVAAAHLDDPNFARSVVLLLAYDEEGGAMGVIVNRPTPLRLARVLPDVPALAGRSDRLWRGGPVLPTSLLTLVRSRENLDGSEAVLEDVRVLTSRKAVLRTLESPVPSEQLRAFAGHAGWAPGQLEAETARGDWTVVPATAPLVFSSNPDELWPSLERSGTRQWTQLRSNRRDARVRHTEHKRSLAACGARRVAGSPASGPDGLPHVHGGAGSSDDATDEAAAANATSHVTTRVRAARLRAPPCQGTQQVPCPG